MAQHREDDLAELLGRHSTQGAALDPRNERLLVDLYMQPEPSDGVGNLVRDLEQLEPSDLELTTIDDEDWLAAYRETLQPFEVGRTWWMDPHPDRPTPAASGRRRLAVEPRMAFGTGSHPSTALVLQELEDLPVRGASVLDVGSGSGVLSLAALRLEAGWAVGFDLDPEAVFVARQIVRDQDFACSPAYVVGSVDGFGPARFDLILCNMISEHFGPIAGALCGMMAPTGTAVFSGILKTEEEAVSVRLGRAGFKTVSSRGMDEWVALRCVRNDFVAAMSGATTP